MLTGNNYIRKLKERASESRVYRKHQLDGLEVAQLLGDNAHKSLYIKLAKEHGGERLRLLAQSVVEREGVKNRGAYFMYLLSGKTTKKRKNHGTPNTLHRK